MLSNKIKISINISFLHDDPHPPLLLFFSPFLIFLFSNNMVPFWEIKYAGVVANATGLSQIWTFFSVGWYLGTQDAITER